jgi:hypothetical protein
MYGVWFTGMRMTDESAELGDWAESGWVNIKWSLREFLDEQPDPIVFDTKDEAEEFVDSEIGVVSTDNGINYYAEDMDVDYITGDWFAYHAVIEEM